MIKTSPKNYITKQEDLNSLTKLIKSAKIIALDTEFTRQTTYYPVLSLIQVAVKNSAGEQESFIVDCLTKIDLSEMLSIINDPQIIKILHSSAQDLQIFHHLSSQIPQGIMDTQIMANFCGLGFNVGYSHLVETFCQRTLDKKEQNSDWQRRPLSTKQLEYAILDVIFLEEIYEKFYEMLSEKNYLDAYFEEIKTFINKTLFRSDDDLTRKISFRNKSAKQALQIKDLISWRENQAKRLNIPRQHFLRDDTIEKIVTENYLSPNFDKKMLAEIEEILNRETPATEKKKFFNYRKAKTLLSGSKKINYQTRRSEKF